MKRKLRNLELLRIYFNYCFSLKTIIIILVSLLILGISIFFLCHYTDGISYYLKNFEDIHSSYINQSILLIEIINAFIISFVATTIIFQEQSFDCLFLSYVSRRKIAIIKLISIFLFFLLYLFLEIIIVSAIGYFEYPYYNCLKEALNIGIYLLFTSFIEIGISFLIGISLNNIFSTVASFIIFLAIIFIKDELVFKNKGLNKFFPMLTEINSNYQIPYYGLALGLSTIIIFLIIYDYKNINNN